MIYGIAARPLAGAESPTGAQILITARRAAVISIGGFAVYDVADASILWAFCCVVDTLSGSGADLVIGSQKVMACGLSWPGGRVCGAGRSRPGRTFVV